MRLDPLSEHYLPKKSTVRRSSYLWVMDAKMVDKRRMDDHRQLINAKLTADWSIGSGQLLTDCQTLIVGNQCEAVLKQRTSHTRQNCFNIEANRAAK